MDNNLDFLPLTSVSGATDSTSYGGERNAPDGAINTDDAADGDLDFLHLAAPPVQAGPARSEEPEEPLPYDRDLALRFFSVLGKEETFGAGERIFAEQDRAGVFLGGKPRVYLLLEGEVSMTVAGKPLNMMLPGETFGELAVISDAPRSATATARKNCRLLWLDQKQFAASLQSVPEFALMLISMMAERLRRSIDKLLATTAQPLSPRTGMRGLSRGDLSDLRRILGNPLPTPMKAGDTIVAKGALGAMMFVLVEGQVTTSIDGRAVEHLPAGGIFGETAMLGRVRRSASVNAETDGAWLPISKADFLRLVQSRAELGLAMLRSMSERIVMTTDLIRTHTR
jgi:CRP-like cAMP-binding protein